ncbi:MAG: hypothetical protein HP494_11865, partial [Nitrospira sp.]|nr:hypothetical protein [Nitrospira sp.]
MAKGLFSEGLADGVQIDQVNFMQGCNVIDRILKYGHLLEGNRVCGVDGDV